MTTSRADVYAGRTGEKIGTIDNALVDRSFPVFCRRHWFWILAKERYQSAIAN